MKLKAILIATTLLAALAASMHAERPRESSEKATFVVTGTVSRVFERDAGHNTEYIVQIRIDAVEKGKELQPKQTLYAYSFRRKPDAPLEPSASGHLKPPREGQRIRARIKYSRGTMEGIYPTWYEILPPQKKK